MACKHVTEIFADGIGQIKLAGGMIRCDLVTLENKDEASEELIPHVTNRIIMTPNGFLATFNSMQQLIDKLVDAGVLSKEVPQNVDEAVNATDTEDAE